MRWKNRRKKSRRGMNQEEIRRKEDRVVGESVHSGSEKTRQRLRREAGSNLFRDEV